MPGELRDEVVEESDARSDEPEAGETRAEETDLHGANGAGRTLPFMEALAERYDVIVPEHPGFGGSDEPDWLDNIHDVAYFYLDFLQTIDLRDVHLVGMSLGGWIALELAVRSTERLKTLTLAGPAGIKVPGLATGDPYAWSPEETMRQAFHDPKIVNGSIVIGSDYGTQLRMVDSAIISVDPTATLPDRFSADLRSTS